ncbi:MAG: efflux RND transporter periplasmic adaptor subunit [Desulfobacterales bacterium]|nr:efflux RND transporter periplasmic adaptor subunit [Desulfobacterales bacterium]
MRATILILLLPFLVACSDTQPKKVAKVRPAILIEVGQSIDKTFLSYPAVIKGEKGSELAFAVGGLVKEVNVKAGQDIKKGQILAKLDQRDFQIRLNSAQAAYKNADKEYQRAVRLLKESAISRSYVDSRKLTRDTTKAQLDTANKAMADTIIVAPYSGNISKVLIEANQTAQPGRTVISMLNFAKLEAKINLPAHILAQSKRYKKAKGAFFLTLEAATNRKIPAFFKEVSLEADTATQTYELILSFTPPEDLVILPGMNATFWMKDLSKTTGDKSISVPITAIGTENGMKFVWVVNKTSMTVSKRVIAIEDGVGASLNILSGLSSGETIVKAGISYLSEGMKVRPWSKK